MVILKLFAAMALDGKTYQKGVYEVVEGHVLSSSKGREAKAGELSRKEADALKAAYPDSVKEFGDGEKIENVAEWKKQNTVIKS